MSELQAGYPSDHSSTPIVYDEKGFVMPLTAEDKEWVKLTTSQLVRDVSKDLFLVHIATCPHGKWFASKRAFFGGMVFGLAIIFTAAGIVVTKLLGK